MDGDGLKPNLLSKHNVGGRSATIVDDQEFQEAEVWETVHDHHHFEPRNSNFMMKNSKSSNCFARSSNIGAPHHHLHGGQPQSSDSLLTLGCQHNVEADHDEDEMIPPHEWIARRLARSQISSSSVCEGVGRTLKGRDLSRVRNAVLTKTGFLEQ